MNVYVRELAGALAASGLRVDVITSSRGVTRPTTVQLGERHRVVTFPGRDGLVTQDLPRYDVIHSHFWRSAPVARALVEHSSARHVHSYHTLGHVKNLTLARGDVPEPAARLQAERAILATADAVVVATEHERRQLGDVLAGSARRIHVVAPGVDHERFRPLDGAAARGRMGLGDRSVVVHLGRIQPLKGVALATRAVGAITRELPRGAALVLAGAPSGPGGAAELAAVRRSRDANGLDVRLTGRWPHAAVPLLLAAADVVVVGSRSETFCLAALEAQACGVPVVGTAVGGLPDFVLEGESGHLVPRSTSALAARLFDVLASRRPHMRAAAVASAARYSWRAMACAVRDVYAV
jgi:D-inositol-3-phosphate glycosyltransferase